MPHPPPPGRLQLTLMVVWPAFVFAGIATALFFSSFDPQLLGEAATFPTELSRMAGYTLGFIGFWLLGCAAGAATLFLVRPYLRSGAPD